MQDTPRTLRVEPADAGRRLDLFLAQRLELSRSQVRRLLARGAVRVDGRAVAESAKGRPLAERAEVEVAAFARPEHQRAEAEPSAGLEVLASGRGWIALDKAAGTPVHPLAEGETGTLLGALLARRPEVQGVGEGGLRSGVVHRLDVDTSGVVLFATRADTWERLREAFRSHRVEKVYRAVVRGRVAAGEATLGLVTARHRPARVRAVSEEELGAARGARLAHTSWRPLERLRGATLVEVRPRTGFLHQIRVTFAFLGHPLLGDATYGGAVAAREAPRHVLHASRVAFEEIAAESPVPSDFEAVCAGLRLTSSAGA